MNKFTTKRFESQAEKKAKAIKARNTREANKLPNTIPNEELPRIKISKPSKPERTAKGRIRTYRGRIANYLEVFEKEGRIVLPTKGSVINKTYGCRRCPYYGSTHCHHERTVKPPLVHVNNLCGERWEEILTYALESESFTGKAIQRREVLSKIGNHITLLETRLSDYMTAKMSEINDKGATETKNLSSEVLKLDSYEKELMGQINKLSSLFADHMMDDMKLEQKIESSVDEKPKNVTFQTFNIMIADAAKKLKEIEDRKKIGGVSGN